MSKTNTVENEDVETENVEVETSGEDVSGEDTPKRRKGRASQGKTVYARGKNDGVVRVWVPNLFPEDQHDVLLAGCKALKINLRDELRQACLDKRASLLAQIEASGVLNAEPDTVPAE